MPEWVTQPGTIIGIAGLVVALIIAYLQWRPKRLDYLVTVDRDLAPGVEGWPNASVRVGDQVLVQPRLLGLRFVNTGRVAIRKEDFEVPLTIKLGETVVTHRVVDFEPLNLRFFARPADDGRALTLDPTLLNPGDWFEYELLLDGKPSSIIIDGRIAGVKAVRDVTDPDPSWLEFLVVSLPFLGSSLTIAANRAWMTRRPSSTKYRRK